MSLHSWNPNFQLRKFKEPRIRCQAVHANGQQCRAKAKSKSKFEYGGDTSRTLGDICPCVVVWLCDNCAFVNGRYSKTENERQAQGGAR